MISTFLSMFEVDGRPVLFLSESLKYVSIDKHIHWYRSTARSYMQFKMILITICERMKRTLYIIMIVSIVII